MTLGNKELEEKIRRRYPVEMDSESPLQKLYTQNQVVNKLCSNTKRKKIMLDPPTKPTAKDTFSHLSNSPRQYNPPTRIKQSLL
mmetsp:Transcript_18829/g.18492  ORF Transcript_18829/g.18492 Transcript_18829/m.18492 type:complete len:84 (+) Transcript_18829:763-1014(+)